VAREGSSRTRDGKSTEVDYGEGRGDYGVGGGGGDVDNGEMGVFFFSGSYSVVIEEKKESKTAFSHAGSLGGRVIFVNN
jgi:hypothetical protein